jgi:hypothetical protein
MPPVFCRPAPMRTICGKCATQEVQDYRHLRMPPERARDVRAPGRPRKSPHHRIELHNRSRVPLPARLNGWQTKAAWPQLRPGGQ